MFAHSTIVWCLWSTNPFISLLIYIQKIDGQWSAAPDGIPIGCYCTSLCILHLLPNGRLVSLSFILAIIHFYYFIFCIYIFYSPVIWKLHTLPMVLTGQALGEACVNSQELQNLFYSMFLSLVKHQKCSFSSSIRIYYRDLFSYDCKSYRPCELYGTFQDWGEKQSSI